MSTRQIIYLIFIISLFATVTNFIPVSVSFAIVILLMPLLVVRLYKRPIPKVYFYLLLLYACFLISTLFYSPSVLIDPGFYRRDGNFFVTYLPMLFLGLVPMKPKLNKIIRVSVVWASFFSLAAYLVLPAEAPHLHHLAFIAHNAAGGFIAMILALCLGQYLERREGFFLLIALLDFFLLWETGSRGTILAFALTFVQVVILKERFTKLLLVGSAIVMIVLLVIVYPFWVKTGGQFSEAEVLSQFPINISRAGTFLIRGLSLWPRAVDNFIKSPVFGQGFGSFDDVPYQFKDFGFAILNTSQIYNHTAAHAHNSYLNFLSETGLIGFFLVVMFLVSLHRFIGYAPIPMGAALGLRLAFWVAVWSAFTEHRLTAPSQMLPFTILIGLVLALTRGVQIEAGNESTKPDEIEYATAV